MNGPQHYAEADAALRRLDDLSADEIQAEMAIAQVHATLALTAAIIETHDNQPGLGESGRTLIRYASRWVGGEDGEEITTPASDWARVME